MQTPMNKTSTIKTKQRQATIQHGPSDNTIRAILSFAQGTCSVKTKVGWLELSKN